VNSGVLISRILLFISTTLILTNICLIFNKYPRAEPRRRREVEVGAGPQGGVEVGAGAHGPAGAEPVGACRPAARRRLDVLRVGPAERGPASSLRGMTGLRRGALAGGGSDAPLLGRGRMVNQEWEYGR
jgi:hypothetical protein